MDKSQIAAVLEAVLFASGDPVPVKTVAAVLGVSEDKVHAAAAYLRERYAARESGICILRMDEKYQLCSSPAYAELVIRALEQRKPPRLSGAALEVLAIVAYFQPVTRAYIDQVRGVDSAYTVGILTERGLIEPCGKLDVPGRPTIYRTGDAFLRTMNISSLDELPSLPSTDTDEGMIALQNKIDELRSGELEGQMSFS